MNGLIRDCNDRTCITFLWLFIGFLAILGGFGGLRFVCFWSRLDVDFKGFEASRVGIRFTLDHDDDEASFRKGGRIIMKLDRGVRHPCEG